MLPMLEERHSNHVMGKSSLTSMRGPFNADIGRQWNMRNLQYAKRGKPLKSWAVLNLDGRCPREAVREFIRAYSSSIYWHYSDKSEGFVMKLVRNLEVMSESTITICSWPLRYILIPFQTAQSKTSTQPSSTAPVVSDSTSCSKGLLVSS